MPHLARSRTTDICQRRLTQQTLCTFSRPVSVHIHVILRTMSRFLSKCTLPGQQSKPSYSKSCWQRNKYRLATLFRANVGSRTTTKKQRADADNILPTPPILQRRMQPGKRSTLQYPIHAAVAALDHRETNKTFSLIFQRVCMATTTTVFVLTSNIPLCPARGNMPNNVAFKGGYLFVQYGTAPLVSWVLFSAPCSIRPVM